MRRGVSCGIYRGQVGVDEVMGRKESCGFRRSNMKFG